MGVGKHEVASCVQPKHAQAFVAAWSRLVQNITKDLSKCYTLGPLPAHVDVKWVEDCSSMRLFTLTKDSANVTAQWLNMLIALGDIGSSVSLVTPKDLVVGSPTVREGPRFRNALPEVASAFAQALVRDRDELVTHLGQNRFDTQPLVRRLGVLADFSYLLQSGAF